MRASPNPRPRQKRPPNRGRRRRPNHRARPSRPPNKPVSGWRSGVPGHTFKAILKKSAKKHRPTGLPSREDVIAFIRTHKGKAGVREIARAFGLKNADRASLRHMLRGLADEGLVE